MDPSGVLCYNNDSTFWCHLTPCNSTENYPTGIYLIFFFLAANDITTCHRDEFNSHAVPSCKRRFKCWSASPALRSHLTKLKNIRLTGLLYYTHHVFLPTVPRTMGMCFRMLQRVAQMLLLCGRLHELECFGRRCAAWTKVLHKNMLK